MSKITRRDFVNGTLMAAGSTLLPAETSAYEAMAAMSPDYYPPARTGLRGSHPGSNEAAHARAWTGRTDWGPTTELSESYDLVVVGGGISGLAAGYFFQQKHGPNAKILILDNHDDFGGHAKRNEHMIDGVLRLGEGGSESIEGTGYLSSVVSDLFDDLGVDLDRFEAAYDEGFYKRHGLGAATFFNERVFGENKVVAHPFCDYPGFIQGLLRPTLSYEEAVRQTPLSENGKAQLLRILNSGQQTLNLPIAELREYVRTTQWYDFLQNTLGVDDPGVLRMARHTAIDYGARGTDVRTIYGALTSGCLGGDPYDAWPDAVDPGDYQGYVDKEGGAYTVEDPFIHHFPDGNATFARTLVKKMIPNVGPGETAEEIVLSTFDYSQLDLPKNTVRLRLNSTAVSARHVGDPDSSEEVVVNYINGGKSYEVKARAAIMAGYNMMIPHIVRDLPPEQDAALRTLTKVVLQYTTVGVTNWRAMKELGIGMAMCPGNTHQVVGMDYPVSIGGYEFTKTPDDPCVLHMRCCPLDGAVGAPVREQFREARYKMLSTSFADYEKEIREHLTGMFPKELFDFDRDVRSISINRWAHAYNFGNAGEAGRQPFGRITIANSDAAASSLVQSAVEQAWRAVNELG